MNTISISKVPYCKRLFQGEFPPLELGCAVATEKGNLAVSVRRNCHFVYNENYEISILYMELWDDSKDKTQATSFFLQGQFGCS